MRKQLITVMFMLIWVCQLSGRYVVMLDYYLNQSYIAKNLCINRDKPQLHCNGKCHLKKQLKEEDRRSQENPERKADNKVEIFCPPADDLLPVPPLAATLHHPLSPDAMGMPVDQPSGLFRPPIAS
ncbi:hypothetical protein [Chitinophaga nivalis]|uniref:Uncharacterized protein n=1 Tax=Chitinophaga nivalis TaxID=2991709 RepID=A0ABT3IJL3_9BACT|nr:hypothetical protein [Chitinophaga nivalis]MCW3466309.1 hypothetical protein [Chitinophaga nivalis]MCW3484000.1 hypothetical protein [Chitinophaga nivalis]